MKYIINCLSYNMIHISYLATSNSDDSDIESEKDPLVKVNETGELVKEVSTELKIEEKPLSTG